MATFYWKSTCTSCRDARKVVRTLAEGGPPLREKDYAKEPLDAEEVRRMVTGAGGVARVLNTRHATAKEKGWKETPPGLDTYVAAVLREPNLLRRPIVLGDGGEAVVGNDPDGWRRVLSLPASLP